jgi:hypothetical protein
MRALSTLLAGLAFLSVTAFSAPKAEARRRDRGVKIVVVKSGHHGRGYSGGRGYRHDRYDYRGYDHYGYDRDGYDRHGYDRYGYDRHGYDATAMTATATTAMVMTVTATTATAITATAMIAAATTAAIKREDPGEPRRRNPG